ncbi:peroxidase-like protein [Dreissena polymorpha]|uniref:peroxidase-like protein n=1 Tax=Dreissena polymorpha TaxID=45954 RepID=UPI0022647665|nr:peroxidase-like protein [Dreissena polymorpha]
MDPEVAKLLQSVYSCPDDIDLFTAIITENRSNGTLVGPLGQKIISDMFKRLRDGDRFFFERDDPVVRFTKEQLAEIKKITLSSLICETTSTSTMQDNAFLFGVPKKPCNEFPKLNFNLWKSS